MIMICLGVAVVIGILIGFVTLCVVWTTRVVGQSVRDRSVSLLSTYDGLLEDRSHRLKELDEELERAKAELEQLKPSAPVRQHRVLRLSAVPGGGGAGPGLSAGGAHGGARGLFRAGAGNRGRGDLRGLPGGGKQYAL